MRKLSVLWICIKKVWADINLLSKGQKRKYALLQLSHRLEKGLLVRNPRPMWGWEKAETIVSLLKQSKDAFSSTTAKAVLSAFLDAKSKSQYQEDKMKYAEFIKDNSFQPTPFLGIGGVTLIKKTVFTSLEFDAIEKMFSSRHSCREFSDRIVPIEIIQKAVQMALKCPSACNRQPFHIFVIEPSKLEKKLGKQLQYLGNKTLIITGDIRAFTSTELLDWIVSPSIFAAYLTLSLHSLGVGSCVVRKDLIKPRDYNTAIRELTGMDESEQIILELFIGYYLDEYVVPVSNRENAKDILFFV